MSFGRKTGRKRQGECDVCKQRITTEECESFTPRGWEVTRWAPVMHRAPCGAHCMGGGVYHGETDVHIVTFGICPRCGESDTEVATIVTNGDETERVVIQRYIHDYRSELGFRIELEVRSGEQWVVKHRFPTNSPHSLDGTLKWAENYIPWLATQTGK